MVSKPKLFLLLAGGVAVLALLPGKPTKDAERHIVYLEEGLIMNDGREIIDRGGRIFRLRRDEAPSTGFWADVMIDSQGRWLQGTLKRGRADICGPIAPEDTHYYYNKHGVNRGYYRIVNCSGVKT